MGDDVVQLTGDPHALLGHPVSRLLLAGPLGDLRAGVHGLQVVGPQPGGGAPGDGYQYPEDGADRLERQRMVVRRVEDQGGGDQQSGGGGEADARGPAVGVDGQPVERGHERCRQQGVIG
jgi:hypothetical protein